MPLISVDIPVAGDWPSSGDMNSRNAITDELNALGIGEFSGAGGGMGAMDFEYEVDNVDAAEATVKAVIAKHLPDREYSLRISHD